MVLFLVCINEYSEWKYVLDLYDINGRHYNFISLFSFYPVDTMQTTQLLSGDVSLLNSYV